MSVTVEDWKGTITNLVVDSSISALALIFLAASELKIDANKDLTLFEANDDIGIGKRINTALETNLCCTIIVERIIEDHELVGSYLLIVGSGNDGV